jgi:diaminopimelate epimerase
VQLPVVKYTSYGNNFVILDETQREFLPEIEKSKFAYYATNQNFGIGSDNFLVIQPCSQAILEGINTVRHYWDEIPNPNSATYIFRMFESDGTEAYSCGNGLMSIANHLHRSQTVDKARIITEIPTRNPTAITIGTEAGRRSNWANMAPPRRVPDDMVDPMIRKRLSDSVDIIENLQVEKVRQSDELRFLFGHSTLTLTGYLVFTGEPHLVVLCPSGFSHPEISRQLFIQLPTNQHRSAHTEKRAALGSSFVDFLGKFFVREFSEFFPVGINLNFIQVADDGESLEHRCFERGINHETLACGTGSLASAIVARELNLIKRDCVRIRPHRCCWAYPEAEIVAEKLNGNWLLKGQPKMLLNGNYHLE